MKAKRVMALVLSAMLTVGSLDTTYLPVLAAGEEQTVTAAEDEAIEDEQTVTAAEDEAIEDEQTVTAAVDEEADEEVLSFGTTSDGFTYEETSKGYKITGYTGAATAITIPDKIGDTYVTEIGAEAFSNTDIVSVTIPEHITALGKGAFSYCTSLRTVDINSRLLADTYTDINAKSYAVFYNAGSLDGMTVTFGEGVEYIPANLFRTYEEETKSVFCRISKVVIADSVTKIGNYAFSRCYNLTTLEGADGVEAIGNNAFEYCGFKELPDFKEATLISERAFQNNTKLKTAVVGSKVKEIKYYAFGENTKLEKLVLPGALTTLGSSVFSGDIALTDVTINSRLLADTYTDINAKSYAVFYNAGSMDGMTVTFGEGVEYIPANLFRTYEEEAKSVYCRVSKVVIADSVTKIGNYAFSRCYKLAALEGADGVETIGNNAFEYCGFKELPDFKEATLISERAFQNNTKLKTAVVGGKVQEIGYYAFGGNTKLEKLVLPRSLTTLGSSAFSGDIALTEVTINSRLLADIYTDINAKSYAVFYNAGAVDGMNVVFGSDVESIPANLFRTYEDETKAVYAKVKRVEINSSLRSLGDYAFGNCYMLDEIHFYGNAPKTFANNALYNVKANAYYPSNDKSWKSDVLKDYGGTITWKKEDGSDVPVSGITLDKTSVDIKVGRTVTLTATVTPSNAANKDVSWSTADSSIATVDNGVVKAVAVGETTITVTTVDGGKQASCKVTVTEGAANEGEEITLPGKKKVPVTAFVTFVTNGGDEQDSYYTLNKKGNEASLHKLVRKGYTFKGWYCTYTDKKGKEKTKKLSALTATTLTKYAADGELILKAQFNPNKYTVKYYKTAKLDGKKVKMKGKAKSWKGAYSLDNEIVQNVTIADGSTITAKDTTLELIGWTRVKYGTETEFATGDSVSLEDLIPDKGKTVKLYPVFVNKQ